MIRIFAGLVIAAMLLPSGAEARKFRFGGGSSRSAEPAAQGASRPGYAAGVGAGVMLSTRPGRAQEPRWTSQGSDLSRVPFTASSTSQDAARVTTAEIRKPWCGSAVVVGGFCVLN